MFFPTISFLACDKTRWTFQVRQCKEFILCKVSPFQNGVI